MVRGFHQSVEDYLAECEAEGTESETAYRGIFNIRIGSDLHRKAAIYAIEHQQSLNSFIEEAVREKLFMRLNVTP